ncbi:outer membrane transport energization protein ExbB [Plasticicumulans lactativorans]|uniref:Biopolymer transport protein ExbB n=1 Tax=Plasticicumulans lactativorans TaxID=1133106 RepID=A0A4R2L5N5_9GAMM|nr:MotA/TolQ/ExbB proton channel family protein [Plasticicumulans lactativorans]TCO82030.1 outer membrane transport energization protein ExbB [Plasticicumulans lactativorans]
MYEEWLTRLPPGLVHLLEQGDAVSAATAATLLLMSLAAWTLIVAKGWRLLRLRPARRLARTLWVGTDSVAAARARLDALRPGPFHVLLQHGVEAAHWLDRHGHPPTAAGDAIGAALQQGLNQAAARLEHGMTTLASVGSTAPFVGLLGTVWGIYHALTAIAAQGQAQIDRIAGPVGEALIMTAFGLAVAIPAVLAYNAFTRSQRLLLADLEAFGHALHARLHVELQAAPAASRPPVPAVVERRPLPLAQGA